MKSFLVPLYLSLSAAVVIAQNAGPAPLRSTHLFTANVTAAPGIVIGPLPQGNRVAYPLTGGTFTGPGLNGTILPVGADFSLTTPDNLFCPDGISILHTSDGANILWRAQGWPLGEYVYASAKFETGAEKYAWLNTAVAVSRALVSIGGSSAGVGLDMFQVRCLQVSKMNFLSVGSDFDTGGLSECLKHY